MVTSADIRRELDFSLRIDVTGKATLLLTLWASVSGADALIGLKSESVIAHFFNFSVALSAFSAF